MKCGNCGAKVPWGFWEHICPQCGRRYPSIRSLVVSLILWSVVLVLATLSMLVYERYSLLDTLLVASLAILVVVNMANIVVLQKKREGV